MKTIEKVFTVSFQFFWSLSLSPSLKSLTLSSFSIFYSLDWLYLSDIINNMKHRGSTYMSSSFPLFFYSYIFSSSLSFNSSLSLNASLCLSVCECHVSRPDCSQDHSPNPYEPESEPEQEFNWKLQKRDWI